MGKHYPASADSHADAKSLAVCIAIANICISKSEPERHCVGKSGADSDNVTNCNAGSLEGLKGACRSIPNRLHPVPGDPVDQLRIRQAGLAR